jgi:aldehyde dehydrogenase (NAD+)
MIPDIPEIQTVDSEIRLAYDRLRSGQSWIGASGPKERIGRLRELRTALLGRRSELYEALKNDFCKSDIEADITELIPVLLEIRQAVKHLRRWMRPHRLPAPPLFRGTTARVVYEPLGVVLIISPWNYPLNLSLGPLVSAVAAGNCAILKPSELTPSTSALLASLVSDVFEADQVAVVEGDATTASQLLRLPFDHVYFTGSTRVGRLVMQAAAEQLTPVTLELGGKSPTIVDHSANVAEAARRIVWGKYLNTGQTCIAPDYVYVHRSRHDELLRALQEQIQANLGTDETDWRTSPTYARSVTEHHVTRLADLVRDATRDGARIVTGGEIHVADRYIAPTILADVSVESRVMQEEIFGPILPVISYQDIDQVLDTIGVLGKPLALYIFSDDAESIRRIMRLTSAGGTVINDVALQFGHPELPFGGVGPSGMGRGHGFAGFKAFSNERSLLTRTLKRSPTDLVYPPYTRRTRQAIETLIRYLSR